MKTDLYLLNIKLFILLSVGFPAYGDDSFEELFNCYSAIAEKPYKPLANSGYQEFHLVVVQRHSENRKNHKLVTTGQDYFMVLNKNGAKLLKPPHYDKVRKQIISGKYLHYRLEENGYRNYALTVTPPGENEPSYLGYFISIDDPNDDRPGIYAAPSELDKKTKRFYKKYDTAEEKILQVDEARTLLHKPINDIVDKASNRVKSLLIDKDIMRLDGEELRDELDSVNKTLSLISNCDNLDDKAIVSGLNQMRTQLEKARTALSGVINIPAVNSKPESKGASGTVN